MKYSIISPGWNCKYFIHDWYKSISTQKVKWTAYVMDDGSTDGTSAKIRALKDKNIKLFRNSKNMGAAYSRWELMKHCDPDSVLVFLDLDDYIPQRVLVDLSKHYQSEKLVTCSRYTEKPGGVKPQRVYTSRQINMNRFIYRSDFCFPPLRTFHGSLIRTLDPELMKIDGDWVRTCTDVALFFQILKHIRYDQLSILPGVQYVYRKRSKQFNAHRFDKAATMHTLRSQFAEAYFG